jgi:hypothetical protein
MCFFYLELELTSGKGDRRGREFDRAGRGRGERGADGPTGALRGRGRRRTVRARQGHGRAGLWRTAGPGRRRASSAINGDFNGERTWGSGGGEETAVFGAGRGGVAGSGAGGRA